MTATPLLSVIIPTANRQEYARAAVKTLLSVCPEAEIVVSDASDSPTLEDMIKGLDGGTNVIFAHSGTNISVIDNFEFALGKSTGEYVVFIGDDDCVGPHIMDVAKWAKTNQVDTVTCYGNTFTCCYYWPGVQSKYFGDAYSAKLLVWPISGAARRIDPLAETKACLRNLGAGLGLMPRAYHGLVSRRTIDAVKSKYGQLFGGVSPDIFSATLISSIANSCWHIDYPFVLPGASPKSTAGLGAARTDRSDLYSNPHITPFKDLVWDPLIPEFYHPTTVWSYSFKQAVDMVDDASLKPNLARLYARCLVSTPGYFKFVKASFGKAAAGQGMISVGAAVLREIIGEGWRFARRALPRLLKPGVGGTGVAMTDGLQDIGAAYIALERQLGELKPALPTLGQG